MENKKRLIIRTQQVLAGPFPTWRSILSQCPLTNSQWLMMYDDVGSWKLSVVLLAIRNKRVGFRTQNYISDAVSHKVENKHLWTLLRDTIGLYYSWKAFKFSTKKTKKWKQTTKDNNPRASAKTPANTTSLQGTCTCLASANNHLRCLGSVEEGYFANFGSLFALKNHWQYAVDCDFMFNFYD